jgi:glutathione S-transferase
MLRLLGRNTSGNVQKVIFLLEELGTPYTREDYGRQFNNTQDAAYLKLNPNGKVPTLVDGDVVVWESNTILRYLASKLKKDALYPTDLAARTQVERWMDWMLAALNYHYVQVFKDSKKAANERAATFEADAKELGTQLSILDGAIAGKAWVAGKDFTLADIALGPVVHRCLDFPIALPALGSLKAWRARLAGRPAFKKATGA